MGTIWNRFDFIRLVLAALVFLYHAVVLSSAAPGSALERHLAITAELAIQGFFIVSGALVYGSFLRSKSLSDYAGKRVRRLFPAYAVIIIVPAIVSTWLMFGERDAAGDILRYVIANLAFLNFLEPDLPGLFGANRYSEVNGALWTIKIEVMFYLVLPVIAWALARLKTWWWCGLAVLIIGAFAWQEFMVSLDSPYRLQLARQLPGQMAFFAAGMAIWKLWGTLRSHALSCFVVGTLSLIIALSIPGFEALRVLGLSGVIIGVAFLPGPALNAARWGDISYGVYIVHFPVVQALVALGVFAMLGTIGGILVAALIVCTLSYLLWWWVEKPALRRDSHYRIVSEEKVPG